ncbi:hypothetical protein CQW23_14165 [Capsicum baccatum]|uniref:Uncharacterized protein n=1 Tax=Capsicum baccatum TaxID=33114 RepID=A0A2G2WID4_CAPBA|nr:hypothetical protein CQW23_14165 [Capsicum baccatum]
MKKYHDQWIVRRNFQGGDMVLLFNSRFKLFPGKLKSKWSSPYKVIQVYSSGVVKLEDNNGVVFKVNGQCVKPYIGPLDSINYMAHLSRRSLSTRGTMAPKARQGKEKATTSQKGMKRGRKDQVESSSKQLPRRMFGIKWVLPEEAKEWHRNNKERKYVHVDLINKEILFSIDWISSC